jgi:hypothetical protein
MPTFKGCGAGGLAWRGGREGGGACGVSQASRDWPGNGNPENAQIVQTLNRYSTREVNRNST